MLPGELSQVAFELRALNIKATQMVTMAFTERQLGASGGDLLAGLYGPWPLPERSKRLSETVVPSPVPIPLTTHVLGPDITWSSCSQPTIIEYVNI